MKKISLALLVMLALAGCTKQQVGCAVEDALVKASAQGIALGLQCSNQDAIAASIKAQADKLNMCPSGVALSLPAAFCAPMVDMLIGSLSGGLIPAAWGCSAQMAQDQVKAFLLKACSGEVVAPVVAAAKK
jgi:hypothetical protein